MARVVFATYMIRYPLGGMLSWALQYLVALQRLGHDVHVVERAHYPKACFDPVVRRMTDDGTVGMRIVDELLSRFGLGDRWCFIDVAGAHFGLSKGALRGLFESADLFVDGGSHGSLLEAAHSCGSRVLIDGEPGYTQMKWKRIVEAGGMLPQYDAVFTNGALLGTTKSKAPTCGLNWIPLYNPVLTEEFEVTVPPRDAAYTTVMNWQSHDSFEYHGRTYGQKDVEFEKFLGLPKRTTVPLEVAVAGEEGRRRLAASAWVVLNAHDETRHLESYHDFIRASRGEFSVCKEIFVALRTGWFSDRSAAYLASGRPVVLQDTGFSEVLPTGEGLFAVDSVEDAVGALDEIESAYPKHSAAARELAREHLDARTLMSAFIDRALG